MADTVTLDADTLARWRADPASFIECLIDPDTGRAFRLLDAERTFLQHMFKTDATGRLLYGDCIFSAPKKTGKTTLGGITGLATVLLFGGRNGEAYCVANDLDQAAGRVFEVMRKVVEATPWLKREAKITSERIVFSTGAVVTAIPSNASSAAGAHPTISIFDELFGFTSERAYRLWDEMVQTPSRRNRRKPSLLWIILWHIGRGELLARRCRTKKSSRQLKSAVKTSRHGSIKRAKPRV